MVGEYPTWMLANHTRKENMEYTQEETQSNRNDWINALRSGKYKQHFNALSNRDNTAFCCLGVACEISGLGKWDKDTYSVKDTETNQYITDASILPEPIKDWLGLSDKSGDYTPDNNNKKGLFSLTELNDAGTTFQDIAELIEREPKGLIAHRSDNNV